MGSFSGTHWLILLVVVIIVFGTSKLKNAGKDLGGAVKGFKDAIKDETKQNDTQQSTQQTDKPVIDSAATKKKHNDSL